MTRELVERLKCDGGCNAGAVLSLGEARSMGWRTLTIQFEGSPYPEFHGNLCPECVEKSAGTFMRLRPGAAAAALLERAAILERRPPLIPCRNCGMAEPDHHCKNPQGLG